MKTYPNCAEVRLLFQNTIHSESLHSCFALKFVSWKDRSDFWWVCRMLHCIMCWFSLPQRDLCLGCPTYSVLCQKKTPKELMSITWKCLVENMFPPACIDNRQSPQNHGADPLHYCGVFSDLKEVKACGLAFCPSLCVQSWVARSCAGFFPVLR